MVAMNDSESQIEEIEHTADWRIRVRGANLEALFRNAAQGMLQLMQGKAQQGEAQIQRIELNAVDIESLLVSWLEELLFVMETQHLVFIEISFQSIQPNHLVAEVSFAPLVELHKEIKAVTYNELAVIKTNSEYTAAIVFDV